MSRSGDRGPRLFRALLALFPRGFRDAFGDEMRQVFAAQLRAARATPGRGATARLWARTIAGMTAAAWHERRAASADTVPGGPILRPGDLRYAVRRLAAAPGFTATVIGTLALCIGANLTIFAVVDSILLKPLPFPEPDRLVTIFNTYPRAGVMDGGRSIANYYDRLPARRHSGNSSHMVARLAPGATLTGAQSQIDAHNAVMERADPEAGMIAATGFRSVVVPLHASHVASTRPILLMLQAGAGLLLLIGLVNVANLFLVRAGGRTRELAVRLAIGARPSHIAAIVMIETVLLSLAAAAVGVPLAM